MKIPKETFLIKISEVLKLKDFCNFKIGAISNCLYRYQLTTTQSFQFIQKNSTNKCAILYTEEDLNCRTDKFIQKFITKNEFEKYFKN